MSDQVEYENSRISSLEDGIFQDLQLSFEELYIGLNLAL